MKKLTNKQENFARLVSEGSTYADAYRSAYDVGKNTSSNTIYVKSSRLMDESKISLRVSELQKKTVKRNEVTLDQVLEEMRKWIMFNPQNITNEDGSIKPLHEMSKEDVMSIQSLDVTELFSGSVKNKRQVGQIKRIKFVDKRAVATDFLRKFGAFVKSVSLEVKDLSHIEAMVKELKD